MNADSKQRAHQSRRCAVAHKVFNQLLVGAGAFDTGQLTPYCLGIYSDRDTAGIGGEAHRVRHGHGAQLLDQVGCEAAAQQRGQLTRFALVDGGNQLGQQQ